MERIDLMIRKWLRSKDHLHTNQNIHRLYLGNEMLGSGLISARDLQLKTLVRLYRESKNRKEHDTFREVNEMMEMKYESRTLMNKIKIHQKYLKENTFMENILSDNITEEGVNKYVDEIINKFHFNKFSKNGKGQAKELINYLTAKDRDTKFVVKIMERV